MHLHVSLPDFVVFAAFFLILKLAIVLATAKWPESAIGKALAVLA